MKSHTSLKLASLIAFTFAAGWAHGAEPFQKTWSYPQGTKTAYVQVDEGQVSNLTDESLTWILPGKKPTQPIKTRLKAEWSRDNGEFASFSAEIKETRNERVTRHLGLEVILGSQAAQMIAMMVYAADDAATRAQIEEYYGRGKLCDATHTALFFVRDQLTGKSQFHCLKEHSGRL